MVTGPLVLETQRHVRVSHTRVHLGILLAAVAEDVRTAIDDTQLFLDDLAPDELCCMLPARVVGQVAPW